MTGGGPKGTAVTSPLFFRVPGGLDVPVRPGFPAWLPGWGTGCHPVPDQSGRLRLGDAGRREDDCLPQGIDVDPAQAVSALPNAATAYLALTRVAHLRKGESVLVHGVAGGLAATFPAVARSLGASRVTGMISSRARIKDAGHLGLDEMFTSDEFVKDLDGRLVDVVVDPVGGEVRNASLDVLASLGRIVLTI
jgi:NADPH:quinone reductase-like Zn-dependent oxidoreductase